MSSSTSLPQYKLGFLQAAISGGALTFGSFLLKSKRTSPYFFNAGSFYRASLLRAISTAFAQTIIAAQSSGELPDFDVVFGPAYKGVPLATATVDKMAQLAPGQYEGLSYAFDRKEVKDHGEGGGIVGAPLKGMRVLVVDDVVTDGKAKREAIETIRKEGGVVVGVVVALDRMEKLIPPEGEDEDLPMPSAIGQLRREFGVPVLAILTLNDIIGGLQGLGSQDDIARLEAYRTKYKASD